MGLREQIKSATSELEITELLSKSKTFTEASDLTRRAWKSTARFRIAQLNSNDPAQTPKSTVTPPKKNSSKKKNK